MNEQSGFSPFPLINMALDNLRLLLLVPFGAAVAAVAFVLLTGGQYTATSTFKPQAERMDVGRLGGLAAQFGIDLLGGGRGESLDFYARLARSRALLEQVATRSYVPTTGPATTLLERYGLTGTGPGQMQLAVETLHQLVTVEPDLYAGVITVRTQDSDPAVAEQMNRAVLDELNRFNLERRQSQASAERQFVEVQVARARRDLEAAEQAQSVFMQTNRRYEEWPQLRAEAARLQRQVDLQQQVFTTLTQALERARLDEVRNTPVITIIDQPEGSAIRQRGLAQRAVLGWVLGLTAVLVFLFVAEYLRRLRQAHPDEFEAVRRRRPWIVATLFLLAGCDGLSLEPLDRPGQPVVNVAAGDYHTCALTAAGTVLCWGDGRHGQLGNRRLDGSPVPQTVDAPVRFADIAAGAAHSCALAEDGSAWCWGWNAFMQRGNSVDTATARPVAVRGGNRFTTITAGSHHNCALKADGSAWCWGYNRYGQLGNGTTSTASEPVPVLTGARFTQIGAGGSHTCAVSAPARRVYCWGLNSVGQLGIASDMLMATVPTPLAGSVTLAQVSLGAEHSCGVADGQLYCWGGNSHGQLAIGGAFPAGLPAATSPVPSPTHIRLARLDAGAYHNCSVAVTGVAQCWGRGGSGQLGNGRDYDQFLPQAVLLQMGYGQTDLLRFSTVASGRDHSCGNSADSVVFCWGSGAHGQLGRRNTPSSLMPLRVELTPRQ
jgi:alpha-tubulin suppressor-like RCC1 family protein